MDLLDTFNEIIDSIGFQVGFKGYHFSADLKKRIEDFKEELRQLVRPTLYELQRWEAEE